MTIAETDKISSETEAKTIAETPASDKIKVLDNSPIDDEALAEVSGGLNRVSNQ